MNPRTSGPLVIVGDAPLDRSLGSECVRTPRRRCSTTRRGTCVPKSRRSPASLAAQAGHDVVLVTPLDDGECGQEILRRPDGRVNVAALPCPGANAEQQRMRAEDAPDAFRYFDRRDEGWTKVAVNP